MQKQHVRARVCAQVSACTKPPLLSSAVKSQTCQERVEYQDSGFSREGLVKKNVKEKQGQRDVKIQNCQEKELQGKEMPTANWIKRFEEIRIGDGERGVLAKTGNAMPLDMRCPES